MSGITKNGVAQVTLRKMAGLISITNKIGLGYSAWVAIGPGTKDNEAALPVKDIERYPCRTQYSSDNSSSNSGYIYSAQHATLATPERSLSATTVYRLYQICSVSLL